MDFFERQDKARRNTKLLVLYFGMGVVALILSVYLAVTLIFAGAGRPHRRSYEYYEQPRTAAGYWNPSLFGGVVLGTLAVIAMGTLFKTMELSQGGKAVANMLGGRLVSPATKNADERKLLNVVEEMAIASGIPVPPVYIMDAEQGINAFAAGHSTSDAVVSVTSGAVRLLSRDELQGVIGHEFSHILNGDMRLNLRLMGWIFGILCLAVIGRILLYTRNRSSRDRNPLPILGLALLVIGWVGVFFGQLIQAAVSRQREFLADASSVQFTRNPDGLAGALKKIGGLAYGSKLQAAHAGEASHMFFGDGVGGSFLGLLATHPPLRERIRALDPTFDGKFAQVSSREPALEPAAAPAAARLPFPFPATSAQRGLTSLAGPAVIAAQSVLPQVGAPETRHLQYAADLRDSLTPALQEAAHQPLGACAMIYALLLSSDSSVRSTQLSQIETLASRPAREETLRILPQVQETATRAKLPLVDLALPALKELSPIQFRQFREAVQKLVDCDQEIDLFEYVLQKIVLRHLESHFGAPRKPVLQYYSLRPLAHECSVVLSALAYVGQDEPQAVAAAFNRGAQPLSRAGQMPLALVPATECGLPEVDAALDRLSQAVPQIRKNVLNACAQTVAADGVIQETEAEMLRAVADTLDCPIPPFLAP